MPADRRPITAPSAPAAVGPYVHAVASAGLLFLSGQIPLDPATGEIVGSSPAEQAARCIENLAAVCDAAGARLEDAVRVTIYTTRMDSFEEINEVYGRRLGADPPARVTVGVAALPKGSLVELDAVVALRV